MKSYDEQKALHGEQYVKNFVAEQTGYGRLNRLLKYIKLKKNDDVIDFACGNAILMPLISQQINSYTGIDFSEHFINAAEENKKKSFIKNAHFFCADINEYCSRHSNQFDKGFALDFSEHVYDDDWLKILKSTRIALKPKAKLYIHTPNGDFFLEKMKNKNFIIKQYPQHIAVRNIEENIKLLEQAGYQIKKVNLLPHYNILKYLHFLSYIPYFGQFFKARIFIEALA